MARREDGQTYGTATKRAALNPRSFRATGHEMGKLFIFEPKYYVWRGRRPRTIASLSIAERRANGLV